MRRPNSAGSAAREEREQAENVRQTAESVAETMATTVAFPVHLARRTAETVRENARSSLDTAAQGFQSLTEQFTNLTGLREAEELARRSFENLQAVSELQLRPGSRHSRSFASVVRSCPGAFDKKR